MRCRMAAGEPPGPTSESNVAARGAPPTRSRRRECPSGRAARAWARGRSRPRPRWSNGPPRRAGRTRGQAARAVRDRAKPRCEARAKKRGVIRDSREAPEDPMASAAGFDAVDEGLSPPPGGGWRASPAGSGWRTRPPTRASRPRRGGLESFPSRFRLANPAAFDSLATLWWVAQALLLRIKPPYRDNKRMAHAMFSLFYNFLQSLSVVQSTPRGKGHRLARDRAAAEVDELLHEGAVAVRVDAGAEA